MVAGSAATLGCYLPGHSGAFLQGSSHKLSWWGCCCCQDKEGKQIQQSWASLHLSASGNRGPRCLWAEVPNFHERPGMQGQEGDKGREILKLPFPETIYGCAEGECCSNYGNLWTTPMNRTRQTFKLYHNKTLNSHTFLNFFLRLPLHVFGHFI